MTATIDSTLASHRERHRKLTKLLADIDYAILGEETEMLYEYKRLRRSTVSELKKEWAIICHLEGKNGSV